MAAYNNYVPFYGLGIGKRFTTLYSIHGYCTYQSCFTVVKKFRQILYVWGRKERMREREWEENKMKENKKNAKDRFNKSWYANINQPKREAHPYWIEKVNPCLLIMIKMLVVFISEIACRPRSFSLISDWNTWYRVWFYMI